MRNLTVWLPGQDFFLISRMPSSKLCYLSRGTTDVDFLGLRRYFSIHAAKIEFIPVQI